MYVPLMDVLSSHPSLHILICPTHIADMPWHLALCASLLPSMTTAHTLCAPLQPTSEFGFGAVSHTPQGGVFPLNPLPTNYTVGSAIVSSSFDQPQRQHHGVRTLMVHSQPSLVIMCFDFIISVLVRVFTAIRLSRVGL